MVLRFGVAAEEDDTVVRAAVGHGTPLFNGPIPGRLTLVDASVPEGSQNAVLTYAIEPEAEPSD